jgi:hypothetical protein
MPVVIVRALAREGAALFCHTPRALRLAERMRAIGTASRHRLRHESGFELRRSDGIATGPAAHTLARRE